MNSRLVNNTNLRASNQEIIHLSCGYNDIPLLDSTTIAWYRDSQILGVFEPPKPTNIKNSLSSYNLSSYLTNGVGLDIKFLPGYSQYYCNITTPGQEISLLVNVVAQSEYQLQIVAPYTATENKEFILECIATFTSGRPSTTDKFVWYRIGNHPQRLSGWFLLLEVVFSMKRNMIKLTFN